VEKNAVEVGNIFSLGTKYTKELGLKFKDEDGQEKEIVMGCYGMGVSRMMGLLAEHFSDDKGLVWPKEVSPFHVYLISIGSNDEVSSKAQELYEMLQSKGIKVLFDDRDVRPGEKFADADLMGIPYRVVISDKNIDQNKFEVKARTEEEPKMVETEKLLEEIR